MSIRRKRQWQRGERVQAKVLEIQANGALLVEIDTQLFIVRNQSRHSWGIGHQISLIVSSINPVELQLPGPGFQRSI